MKRLGSCFICLFVLCVVSSGVIFGQGSIVAKFVARAHTVDGSTLLYRLFIPDNYSPGQKYPLVLTLHGAGEAGTDNLKQIQVHRLATSWAEPANQAKHPCFVVSPQIAEGQWWSDDTNTALISSLLDSMAREFSIDTNRLYVTGLSLGGFATWDLITRFPGRFAAAVPMSAGSGTIMVNTPIWDFHGQLDRTVPVTYSRITIEALKASGRTVIYTNCHNNDCTGLPDSTIAMYVKSHADLLYTEYQGLEHPIWDISYNNPLLMEWVFDKYRITPGAITITSPASNRRLQGLETVTWSSSSSVDSVEIWYTPDAGTSWQMVSRSEPNNGSYQWDTHDVADGAFGMLKLFVKNKDGFIHGHDQSGYLSVDNGSQGTPFVKILSDEFTTSTVFSQDRLTLKFLAGDSRSLPLNVRFYGSADAGLHFDQFDGYTAALDSPPSLRVINLAQLTNSDREVIRVDADNGVRTVSDQTYPFIKQTLRLSGPGSQHISGQGGGTVKVNVVDRAALTGDLYRVMFDDTSLSHTYYDVVDVTRGMKVVSGAATLDGSTEGPVFDGIRLVVKNYEQASVDPVHTRWEVGDSSIVKINAIVPRILVGGILTRGFAYSADYSLSFFDHAVDTSSDAILGKARAPLNFRVENLTEKRKSDVAFDDADNNHQFSRQDKIYILEPDSLRLPRLTWELSMSSLPATATAPKPGDRFILSTLKRFRSGDVFEFSAVVASLVNLSEPPAFTLHQNYPNPFNPSTTIRYSLPERMRVTLTVYDLLGRRVIDLVNGLVEAGVHDVRFDGRALASGVYFYRLQVRSPDPASGGKGAFIQTRKLLLLR